MYYRQKRDRLLYFLMLSLAFRVLTAVSPAFAQDPSVPVDPAQNVPAAAASDPAYADAAVAPAADPALDPAATATVAPLADGTTAPAGDGSAAAANPAATEPAEINPNTMASVLFNKNEHELIKEARRSIGLVRPTTQEELNQDLQSQQEEKIKPPPEERYIRLGGIVYASNKNWTIWLNEQRVTPKALPREVLDLRVFKDFIEIKWFDDYSNQIFPIRLRPHQRFNIDTRIFLPG